MKSHFAFIPIILLILFHLPVSTARSFGPPQDSSSHERSITGKIIYDAKTDNTMFVQLYKLPEPSAGAPRNPSKTYIYSTKPNMQIPVFPESSKFEFRDLPQGYYAVVAFQDIKENEKLDFQPAEPWGWYTSDPGGPIEVIDLTQSDTATADCTLRVATHLPKFGKTAEHGRLRWMEGLPVLQLSGTPEQRGYAHGNLVGRQILDFFEFYIIEESWRSYQRYQETFYPFLKTRFNCPVEFIAECNAVIKGMKDSGVDMKIPHLNREFDLYDLLAINAYIERRAVNPVATAESCTQFAFWGRRTQGSELTRGLIAARNMDGECDIRKVTVSHFLLFAVDPADPKKKRWFSAMWPGFVGTISGINEDGLYSMENAGPSGPGPVVGGIVPCSWVQRHILETAGADATPKSILQMMQPFASEGGGVTTPGSIILWATPNQGQEYPAFVYEGDRNGGLMRFPTNVPPIDPDNIMASNHHKIYGCLPGETDICFGKKVTGSTLQRYNDGLKLLEDWSIQDNTNMGLAQAIQCLQTAAHGTTEYSIIFEANRKRILIAVDDLKPDAWDAPFKKWTAYQFDELFK